MKSAPDEKRKVVKKNPPFIWVKQAIISKEKLKINFSLISKTDLFSR